MSEFDAARARGKRPMPLWVDAFHRDTQHLEPDEVGAYMLILMAMWTRPSCDLPDDDRRMAKVCRVSTRLWRSRIGPVIRPFLAARDGVLISERLRKEATYVERQITQQSDRKKGKKSDKPLNNNDQGQSVDTSADNTTDQSGENPSQQPNDLQEGGGGSARAPAHPPAREEPPPDQADPQADTWRETLCRAMGLDPTGITPGGRIPGTQADMAEAQRWIDDLGLSKMQIIRQVREVMAAKADGPPKSFKYFTPAMQRLAAQKAAPKLEPAPQPQPHQHHGGFYDAATGQYIEGTAFPQGPPNRPDPALEQIIRLTGARPASGYGGD